MHAYRPAFHKLLVLALLPVSVVVHAAGDSFVDEFVSEDTSRWSRTIDALPAAPVASGWRADHVAFAGGNLELRVNTSPCTWAPEQCAGRMSASGQLRSDDTYGVGRYTAVLQAASGQGVVTDFMRYSGASVGMPTDLIGMHFQGQDPTRMQVSYFLSGSGLQYQTVDLGFNAAASHHTYAFDWNAGSLRWYVDGGEVFSVASALLPSIDGYIVGDVWAASPAASAAFGTYAGTATRAYFDRISYEIPVTAPVPEPTTAWMMVAGVGLLGWRRHRKSSCLGTAPALRPAGVHVISN